MAGARRLLRPLPLVVGAAVLVALVVVHVLVLTGPLNLASYLIAVWAGPALAWYGVRLAPPGRSLVPRLIALGLTASAIGDVIWEAYAWTGHEPNVSLADIPYFASYVGLGGALAVITLVRTSAGSRINVDAVIDALTVVTVSVLIFWNLSIAAIVGDDSVSAAIRLVWAAYPVADAILLALVARVLFIRRTRSTFDLLFAAGIVCWLVADAVYLRLTTDSETVGALMDVGWMLGAVLMGAATLRRPPPLPEAVATEDRATEDGAAEDGGDRRTLAKVGIAIVPLLVPAFLDLFNHLRGVDQPFVSPVGMAALLILAFVRMARLVQSESRARAAAATSRRHYARLSANSSDAVIVVGPDGRVLNDSPQLTDWLGGDGPVRGEPWITLVGARDVQELTTRFAEVVASPGEVANLELQVVRPDGDDAWLGARLVNLLTDPDVHGVVIALADITARKESEAELELARDAALEGSRAKSQFLATMSHEIRTPMNGVIGLTGLLLNTELNQRQREYVEGVHGAGESLLKIINDILDFSKIEAGKLELELIDFNLVQVIEEAAELVAESAQGKGLELLAYCSPEVPISLRGDPSRLRQVLLNLASNAVKFTDQGEVVIRALLEDRDGTAVVVRFEVTDSGIGLDVGDQQRLFEPFSQADSSTTRRFGGTGLGLAICHQLVHAMGGSIGVHSDPGRGSTFWFTLPLSLALDPRVAPPRSTRELAGLRVLVVDDNQTNRLILGEQLTAWAMRPDVVEDAASALRRLEEAAASGEPYTIAVLDLCMPGTDGLQLAQQISRTPALADVALVLLTSGRDVGAEEAFRAGVDARLTKPVHLSRLHVALQEVGTAARVSSVPATEQPENATTKSRGHVLIVEDNHVNQLVAVGILEHLGFTTEVAGNGVEALASLARSSFDAVLMDCQMPVMDGYDATARIREDEQSHQHLPVIAMTAGVTDGERGRCLAAGMDDFVPKPVSPVELDSALARWLPVAAV